VPDGAPSDVFAPTELLGADAGSESVIVAARGPTLAPGETPKRELGILFWMSFGWVALLILLAVLAPVLSLKSPTFQDYSAVNVGPTLHHVLGTDDLGRDLLSRIIWGSRVSLIIGFTSIGLGLLVGGTFGLFAGLRGGAGDTLLNAGSFVLLAFPPLLAILVIEAFWGRTLWKLVLMFALIATPQLFRVVRATTLSFADREFVVAARTMGARASRILLREVLPNVVPAAISFALLGVALAIILEGSLAFLGLSIQLPVASLGNIVNAGVQNDNLQLNPYIALWPSLYIFLLLTSLNLMADRLRARYDVREVKL
jgi:peptide/nickel transport system permease protein